MTAKEPTGPRKKSGGRKQGSRNKATVERELKRDAAIKAAKLGGMSPLEIMLHRARGTAPITDRQFEGAVAAAPYCHPKLVATAQGTMEDLTKHSDEQLLSEIDRLRSQADADAAFTGDAQPDDPA